jgi:hypothetical protein
MGSYFIPRRNRLSWTPKLKQADGLIILKSHGPPPRI